MTRTMETASRRKSPAARAGAVAVCLAWGSGSAPAGGRVGAEPDPHALVKRMVAAYKRAGTYQEVSEAIIRLDGNEIVQSTRLHFKRPNLFQVTTLDPLGGTFSSYSDGRTVMIYTAKSNLYAVRKSGNDLRACLGILDRSTKQALGLGTVRILNPLNFIAERGAMPGEAKSFRYAGEETVNGRRAHRLTAQADAAWLRTLFDLSKVQTLQRDITLWVDRDTGLLVKGAVAFKWRSSVGKGKGRRSVVRSVSLTETHREMRADAPVRDDVFRFIPPKNARQIFREARGD